LGGYKASFVTVGECQFVGAETSRRVQEKVYRGREEREEEIREANGQILSESGTIFEQNHQKSKQSTRGKRDSICTCANNFLQQ